MSLETTFQKLNSWGKVPFWKFLFLTGIIPSILTVAILPLLTPTLPSPYLVIAPMLIMAFAVTYMLFVFGGLLLGVALCWVLIRLRNSLYVKHGVITANSLATNDEFLTKLGKGLYPKLRGFIRGYNDPKFEELQKAQQRQQIEIEELKQSDQNKTRMIARQGLAIFFVNWEIKKLKRENEELRKNQEESKTLVADKIQGNNKIEDSKP